MEDIFYCFECNYKARTKEKPFLKDILNNFTKDEITGFVLFVNNNMYSLQFHIGLYFETDTIREKFDQWLVKYYPNKSLKPNIRAVDLIKSANVISVRDETDIDIAVTPYGNAIFLFAEQNTLEQDFPQYQPVKPVKSKIFLSHSSLDKKTIVQPIFNYLQSRQLPVWLDKYEIDYGDNIYQKVSEGIQNAEFAIFVLTENFLASKWASEELSSLTDLIFNNYSIVIVDMENETLIPKIISARKYMKWDNGNCLPAISDTIKRKLNI
ncbi:hypothetical protein HMPREF9120_00848 [Neisseria sp. oral taxon 020 str. F0370]|uniref:toll/interleukin-1 receptor domain-containing protein n=1 Tax=unclassified Neisseria TaxID=2623750 RepID=UPI0002A24490|nr:MULTISPECIES: toll/interleukin-1 receptor domain-containing protein [unclassified Neisseria]ASP18271.1 toll/interleukin-1 receptor domain-containing protein [Neisseria sp. KEM232]EKY07998.1 hypothetical protein HMPREF9120_00848 [Neisseria sp. oral taxon 020 str. F0370]